MTLLGFAKEKLLKTSYIFGTDFTRNRMNEVCGGIPCGGHFSRHLLAARWVPALTGMTPEVFRELSGMWGAAGGFGMGGRFEVEKKHVFGVIWYFWIFLDRFFHCFGYYVLDCVWYVLDCLGYVYIVDSMDF